MKVTVGVSNRHVHLTKETYETLFPDRDIEKRNDLNQGGEFASTDTVDLVLGDKIIPHVRVLGPFRSDNQIEILGSDIEYLGIEVPARRSGDLANTPGITLKAGENTVEVDHGVIRAEKHVHVPENREAELDLHEGEMVTIYNDTVSFQAKVKITKNGYFEVHIDKDEALEYNLENGTPMELKKCGE